MLKLSFDRNRDHYWGELNATIELMQYGGYQCSYSGDTWPIVRQLKESLGSDLRYVFRHFPLPNLHNLAMESAVAAEAAGLQGKFWLMHEKIMENQLHLNRASLNVFAEDIGVDMSEFVRDCRSRQLFKKITNDFESGINSGVSGTPTFFVNGLMYNGFDDFASLHKVCRFATGYYKMTG
jgi:protein-disulfide isomerase